MQQNKLYWKKQSEGWFTNSQIVCYDIDKGECSDFFDAQSIGWYIYCGAGFRIHPQTDEMYVSLYLDNLKQTYQTVRLSPTGEVSGVYEMIDNYWFTAMIIFPPQAQKEPTEPGDTTAVEQPSASSLRIYPNPATESVYIDGAYAQLRIYDLTGRLLHTYAAQAQIPVADLRPGIYVFHLTDTHGQKAIHKIVIR